MSFIKRIPGMVAVFVVTGGALALAMLFAGELGRGWVFELSVLFSLFIVAGIWRCYYDLRYYQSPDGASTGIALGLSKASPGPGSEDRYYCAKGLLNGLEVYFYLMGGEWNSKWYRFEVMCRVPNTGNTRLEAYVPFIERPLRFLPGRVRPAGWDRITVCCDQPARAQAIGGL